MDENCNEIGFDTNKSKRNIFQDIIKGMDRVLSVSGQVFLLFNESWVQQCEEVVLIHVLRDIHHGMYKIFSGNMSQQFIPLSHLSTGWKYTRASKKFITITLKKCTYGIGFTRARDAQECLNQFGWLNNVITEEASVGSEPGENVGANTPVVKVSEALLHGPFAYDRESAPLRMMPGLRDLLKIESKLERPETQTTNSPTKSEFPCSPRRTALSTVGSPKRSSRNKRSLLGDSENISDPLIRRNLMAKLRDTDSRKFSFEERKLEGTQCPSSTMLAECEPDAIFKHRPEIPIGDVPPSHWQHENNMTDSDWRSNRPPLLDNAPIGRSTPVNMHHIVQQQQQMLMNFTRHSTPFAQLFMTGLKMGASGGHSVISQSELSGASRPLKVYQEIHQSYYKDYMKTTTETNGAKHTLSTKHFDSENHSPDEDIHSVDEPSSLNDLITAFEPLGFDNSVIHSPRKRSSL